MKDRKRRLQYEYFRKVRMYANSKNETLFNAWLDRTIKISFPSDHQWHHLGQIIGNEKMERIREGKTV